MEKDIFEYQVHIEQFSWILLWLMLLCFLGLIITGWTMQVMSRFFLTEKNKETGETRKFSIINFELPYSYANFKSIINNISERTKDTVRMNLNFDYYFMPFAYLFLFFGGWYMLHSNNYVFQESGYYRLLFIPFAAWFFDMVENKLALYCLDKLTKTNARMLFGVSLVKWLLIIGYIIIFLVICYGG